MECGVCHLANLTILDCYCISNVVGVDSKEVAQLICECLGVDCGHALHSAYDVCLNLLVALTCEVERILGVCLCKCWVDIACEHLSAHLSSYGSLCRCKTNLRYLYADWCVAIEFNLGNNNLLSSNRVVALSILAIYSYCVRCLGKKDDTCALVAIGA